MMVNNSTNINKTNNHLSPQTKIMTYGKGKVKPVIGNSILPRLIIGRVSKGLLFNAKNKLILNEMMMGFALY